MCEHASLQQDAAGSAQPLLFSTLEHLKLSSGCFFLCKIACLVLFFFTFQVPSKSQVCQTLGK